jgi:uncharacterized protein
MSEHLFNVLYTTIINMLREKLPANLYYHSPEHTMDVVASVERIALAEQCTPEEVLLLKTAALFHDTGYVHDMREHERHGCVIATEMLSANKVDSGKIALVCSLVMATKVPQSPQTKLEEIMCDADLDYLGRDDYFTIAENLHREFLAFEKVTNEKDWIQLQLNFLQAHSYFTRTNILQRQPGAVENLKKIREAVAE